MGEDRRPLVGGDHLDSEFTGVATSHFLELLLGPADGVSANYSAQSMEELPA